MSLCLEKAWRGQARERGSAVAKRVAGRKKWDWEKRIGDAGGESEGGERVQRKRERDVFDVGREVQTVTQYLYLVCGLSSF